MDSNEELLEMLSSDKASTRVEACEGLRVIPESSPEIIQALEKATQDKDPEVALRAYRALQADVHHQMAIDMGMIEPDKPEMLMTEVTKPVDIEGKKFGPRAGAYLLDLLASSGLTFVLMMGVGFILGVILYFVSSLMGRSFYVVESDIICVNYIIGFIESMVYFALFEWLYGRTIGKVILGMRVISSDGKTCTFKQACIRSFYRLIDGFFFGLVAYSSMKPPSHQRIGDKRASTFVVSSKDPIIKDQPAWWKFLIALVAYLLIDSIITLLWMLLYIRFV